MKGRLLKLCMSAGMLVLCLFPILSLGGFYQYSNIQRVFGQRQFVVTKKEDNFTALAQRFDVGYDQIALANPRVDSEKPLPRAALIIPSQFLVPSVSHQGIVINLAQMRLYYFPKHVTGQLYSYPIGIGKEDWSTPEGSFYIQEKIKHPVWVVPDSIFAYRQAHGDSIGHTMAAGPDNPLGDYALRLSKPTYLIHGTNDPSSVGRRSSAGCIHLFGPDIKALFELTSVRTPVRIVYQPVLLTTYNDHIWIEVHPLMVEQQGKMNLLALFKQQWQHIFIHRDIPSNILKSVKQIVKHPTGLVLDLGSVSSLGLSRGEASVLTTPMIHAPMMLNVDAQTLKPVVKPAIHLPVPMVKTPVSISKSHRVHHSLFHSLSQSRRHEHPVSQSKSVEIEKVAGSTQATDYPPKMHAPMILKTVPRATVSVVKPMVHAALNKPVNKAVIQSGINPVAHVIKKQPVMKPVAKPIVKPLAHVAAKQSVLKRKAHVAPMPVPQTVMSTPKSDLAQHSLFHSLSQSRRHEHAVSQSKSVEVEKVTGSTYATDHPPKMHAPIILQTAPRTTVSVIKPMLHAALNMPVNKAVIQSGINPVAHVIKKQPVMKPVAKPIVKPLVHVAAKQSVLKRKAHVAPMPVPRAVMSTPKSDLAQHSLFHSLSQSRRHEHAVSQSKSVEVEKVTGSTHATDHPPKMHAPIILQTAPRTTVSVVKPMVHAALNKPVSKAAARPITHVALNKPVINAAVKPFSHVALNKPVIQSGVKPVAHVTEKKPVMKPIVKPMVHVASKQSVLKRKAHVAAKQPVIKPVTHTALTQSMAKPIVKPLAHVAVKQSVQKPVSDKAMPVIDAAVSTPKHHRVHHSLFHWFSRARRHEKAVPEKPDAHVALNKPVIKSGVKPVAHVTEKKPVMKPIVKPMVHVASKQSVLKRKAHVAAKQPVIKPVVKPVTHTALTQSMAKTIVKPLAHVAVKQSVQKPVSDKAMPVIDAAVSTHKHHRVHHSLFHWFSRARRHEKAVPEKPDAHVALNKPVIKSGVKPVAHVTEKKPVMKPIVKPMVHVASKQSVLKRKAHVAAKQPVIKPVVKSVAHTALTQSMAKPIVKPLAHVAVKQSVQKPVSDKAMPVIDAAVSTPKHHRVHYSLFHWFPRARRHEKAVPEKQVAHVVEKKTVTKVAIKPVAKALNHGVVKQAVLKPSSHQVVDLEAKRKVVESFHRPVNKAQEKSVKKTNIQFTYHVATLNIKKHSGKLKNKRVVVDPLW